MIPKRLAQFLAPISETAYYTVPADNLAVVKQIIVANTAVVEAQLGLSLVPFGGVASNANRILPNIRVAPNSLAAFDFTSVMDEGDFISAVCTVAASVAVTISGLESPGTSGLSGGTVVSNPPVFGSPVALGTSLADGVSTSLARADHAHIATFGSPVATGSALAPGGSNTAARADHVHTIADSGWQTPTLQNSWTVYGDGNYGIAAVYRKIGGVVYMRGLLNSAAATAATAFTLPVGYRPGGVTHLFVGHADNGAQRFDIGTNGTVGGPTGRGWVSFANISFIAEN